MQKKRIFILTVLLISVILLVGSLISCSSSGSRDPGSSPKDIIDGPAIPLNGDADITSIEGGEINGLNMSLEVTDVETIDLPNILTTSYGVSLKVYKDAEKQNEVSKSAINLQNGENLFYIVVTSEDNKKSETYKLMVLKNCNVVLTIENEDLEAGTVEGAGKKAGGVSTTITATAKQGCSFEGWYDGDEKVSSEATYTFVMPMSDKTLLVKWTYNEYELTLVNDYPEAGTVEGGGFYEYCSRITVKATPNAGYTFAGWYDGETKVSIDDELTFAFNMPNENKTYEARWKAKEFTLTLNPNQGVGVPASIIVTYDASYEIPAPTRAGYTFDGWYLDTVKVDNTGIWTKELDMEIMAHWTAIEYTIGYTLNGGVVDPANLTKYTTESLAITLNNPTKEGYTFIGWSGTDLEGSANMSVTITSGSSGHREYTATWQPITCTVSFDVNGGSSTHSTVDITSGDTIAFPVPTHSDENMAFLGWCTDDMGSEQITDAEGVGLELWANDNTTITLYAMWRNASCDISSYLRVNGDEANTPNPNGTHILFGEYPQTIKSASVTMTNFQDARGYYLGRDGFYYAKVVATPCYSGYKFSNNTTVNNGTTYYFKVEPIKWRILNYNTLAEDGNKALLLCESIIANKRYDDSSNNYKESEIRAWLNNEFYNTAFSELQQQLIQITEVDNSVYSTGYESNPYVCQNTNDKIFLPSYREVTNTEYGFSSNESRARKTSDYSRATGVAMSTDSSYYGNGFWWLRSPDYDYSNGARDVIYDGYVYYYYVYSTYGGVVPALVISLT